MDCFSLFHDDESGLEMNTSNKDDLNATSSSSNLADINVPPTEEFHISTLLLAEKGYCLLNENEAEKLSTSLVSIYEPELVKVQTKLTELTKKQDELIFKLQSQNKKLDLASSENSFLETFDKVKSYHLKLTNLKKDMTQLHEKSMKLKKRGLKLLEQHQKEALQRELNRDKEQQLITSPSTSSK